MNIAYRFRIYPNREQEVLLAKTFGCCRFLYNQMLNDKIREYEATKKMLRNMRTRCDPDQAIYEWRNANPESFLEKMHDSESQIIQYAKWKQVVIEILIRLPSADEGCGQWVTNSRDIVHKILVSHNVAMRDGITMNDAIKIKTRDKKHPDFRKIPIRCYFEIKSKAEYVQASELSFRCHSFSPK